MTKILIVDDIPEYINSLSRALSGKYQILKAMNIEEAKATMNESVDLALLDIRLSESDRENRDGILLLEWIKEQYPKTPVIMMSAYKDFDAAVDALNLEASYYLKKPVNLRELNEMILSLTKEQE